MAASLAVFLVTHAAAVRPQLVTAALGIPGLSSMSRESGRAHTPLVHGTHCAHTANLESMAERTTPPSNMETTRHPGCLPQRQLSGGGASHTRGGLLKFRAAAVRAHALLLLAPKTSPPQRCS